MPLTEIMYEVFPHCFILLYSLIHSNYSFHIMDSIDREKKNDKECLSVSDNMWNEMT